MGLPAFLGPLLSAITSGCRSLFNLGASSVTKPLKDLSGTAKDVTGIRRDLIEIEWNRLRLDQEKKHIKIAEFSDIEQYDPNHDKLLAKVLGHRPKKTKDDRLHSYNFGGLGLVIGVILTALFQAICSGLH